MTNYDNNSISELTELLFSRDLKINKLRNKSFMVSLLTYLENNKVQQIAINDNNEYVEENEKLHNTVKLLEEELNDKNHQLKKMKDNSISYENFTLEAEEAFNKKIREQDDLIRQLKSQITNLNNTSETFSCENCSVYEKKITELNRDLELKSLEIANLCTHAEELENKITDLAYELSLCQRAQTQLINKSIQVDEPFISLSSTNEETEAENIILDDSHSHQNLNHVPTTALEPKHKLLLLADSHGRKCGEIMKEIFDENKFETSCFFKPNAHFEGVVDNVIKQCKNFTKSDFVVIFGGSNIAHANKIIEKNFIELIKQALSHTNIVVVLPPLWKNKIKFNSYILQNNFSMLSVFKDTASFINLNSFLTEDHFTRHGVHINNFGKHVFIEKLHAYVLSKIDNNQNLFRAQKK